MLIPLPRHRARRILVLAVALLATCAALIAAPAPAHGAATVTTPVYSGKGWKAWTSQGIYSISPDPYVIVFANATARTKLAKYFTGPAAQITTVTGVPVTVSTTLDTTPAGSCPPRHRIVVHYVYRPSGVKGMSQARGCHQVSDGSAYGGHILMDNEYWTVANWFSTNPTVNETYKKDANAHELGHIMGLDHPNTDLNKDGVIASGECVKNTAGVKPLLCSKNRGYTTAGVAGKYTTAFDVAGLRQMAANWYLRQTA